MTGGLARDSPARAAGRGARRCRAGDAGRPPEADARRREQRPRRISVTSVDRLKADPFAFYAQAMLGLRRIDPVDADHSAAWKGTRGPRGARAMACTRTNAIPTGCCRAPRRCWPAETIHPMLRALWQPRLMEAIRWVEEQETRQPRRGPAAAGGGEYAARPRSAASLLHGKADRIDRLERRRARDRRLQDRQSAGAKGGGCRASRCSSACSG